MRGCLNCLGVIILFALLGGGLRALTSGGSEPSPTPIPTFVSPTLVAFDTPEPVVTPEPTPSPTTKVVRVSLADALSQKLVTMTAAGKNLQQLSLDLVSLAKETLEVIVDPGLIFEPAARSTQPMVVTSRFEIRLDPGDTASRILDVACDSMHLDEPGAGDTFKLSTTRSTASLRALVGAPSFSDAAFRIQQFAIWTLTDNPTRTGYVELGSFGVGSGPDAAEIAVIKTIFTEAGLDPAKYRALR
jgi:hypothetical protein